MAASAVDSGWRGMTLQGLDVSGYRNRLNIFEMLATAWRLASRCPDRLQEWMADLPFRTQIAKAQRLPDYQWKVA